MLFRRTKSEGIVVSGRVSGARRSPPPPSPRRAGVGGDGLDEGVDELVEADGPRVPVEVGVEVLRQGLEELVTEVVEVLLGDLPLRALGLQVGHDDVEGRLVVSGRDDHREAVEDALGEGLELGRVDIVPAVLLDHVAGRGVRLENIAVQLVGELETLGSLAEGLDPLTPDLDPLEQPALGRDGMVVVVVIVVFSVVGTDDRYGGQQQSDDYPQLHLSARRT